MTGGTLATETLDGGMLGKNAAVPSNKVEAALRAKHEFNRLTLDAAPTQGWDQAWKWEVDDGGVWVQFGCPKCGAVCHWPLGEVAVAKAEQRFLIDAAEGIETVCHHVAGVDVTLMVGYATSEEDPKDI
jgi:hypothetical protein